MSQYGLLMPTSLSLVLNAASMCLIVGRRSRCAHFLQPHVPLGVTSPRRWLHLSSLQPCCRSSKQRLRLLSCCRLLSTAAFRMARTADGREGRRSMNHRISALISRRCLGVSLWRFWTESASDACHGTGLGRKRTHEGHWSEWDMFDGASD